MTQLAPKPDISTSEQKPSAKRNNFGWKGILVGIVIGVIVSGIIGRLGQSETETTASDTPTEETAIPQQPSRAVTVIEVEP